MSWPQVPGLGSCGSALEENLFSLQINTFKNIKFGIKNMLLESLAAPIIPD